MINILSIHKFLCTRSISNNVMLNWHVDLTKPDLLTCCERDWLTTKPDISVPSFDCLKVFKMEQEIKGHSIFSMEFPVGLVLQYTHLWK